MTRADIEATIFVVGIVGVVIVGIGLVVADDVRRTNTCNALGGVRVESKCAKIEIITEWKP